MENGNGFSCRRVHLQCALRHTDKALVAERVHCFDQILALTLINCLCYIGFPYNPELSLIVDSNSGFRFSN